MRIWIVEDERWESERVKEMVTALRNGVDVLQIFDFKLPSDQPLPKVVILDLYEAGSTLQGKKFYEELRSREKSETHKALVIVWSAYQGLDDGSEFVKKSGAADSRLISLPTKSLLSLKEALRGCFERIEQEDY